MPPSEVKDDGESEDNEESEELSLLSEEPSTKRLSSTSRMIHWSDRTARKVARTHGVPR